MYSTWPWHFRGLSFVPVIGNSVYLVMESEMLVWRRLVVFLDVMMIPRTYGLSIEVVNASNYTHKESNFNISAWEYEAPTTMPPLPGALRGTVGLLRQNGDDDRLGFVSHSTQLS